ncbi:hypothetical protein IMCC21224_12362 [Puniceibacterium sp. IMCC21224]|nr:hypothetical protein IMCC21224_12362 [Puniceibacterium sp. IMCC21224]
MASSGNHLSRCLRTGRVRLMASNRRATGCPTGGAVRSLSSEALEERCGFCRAFEKHRHILPSRKPSDLTSAATRARILMLTSGVTAHIFRLMETAAEAIVFSDRERLDVESFGDNLVLPLMSMTQTGRRQSRKKHAVPGASMTGVIRLPVAPRPFRDELLSSWMVRVAAWPNFAPINGPLLSPRLTHPVFH